MPQNNPLDGELAYYGNSKTRAKFLEGENQWKLEMSLYNTTALSDEIDGRFMLGKQNWTVEGDSKKCHFGKPYEIELKLTGCKDGEFTCDDGQCINMERRCDQVTGKEPDCRDKSDEKGCKLIVFEGNYNKITPPIESDNGIVIPTDVSISITLMKVVEIEETDHSIHLQFQISFEWRENRVKYLNLKRKTSLNALTKVDIEDLWLPLIIYDNTDQKESTRLAPWNDWETTVTVTREGEFMRSDLRDVDEIEIFKGSKNKLTMYQTYTKQFQCKYQLHRYPFDTQVWWLNI